MAKSKICKTCRQNKSISQFHVRSRTKGTVKYRTQCRICFYIENNKRYGEKNKKRAKEYYATNKQAIREKAKKTLLKVQHGSD